MKDGFGLFANVRREVGLLSRFVVRRTQRLIGFRGLASFLLRGPSASAVKRMYQLSLGDAEWRNAFTAAIMSDLRCAEVVRQRHSVPGNLLPLRSLPTGSLGKSFADFVLLNNLQPPIKTASVPSDPFSYIIYRIVNSHDIYHVLLDVGTDPWGEMVVAAFTNAQLPLYFPAATHIAGAIGHAAIANKTETRFLLGGCHIGYGAGISAVQLFATNWAELWPLPIDEARKRLGIEAVTKQTDSSKNGQPSETGLPTLYELRLKRQYTESTTRVSGYDVYRFRPREAPKAVCVLGRALFADGRYFFARKQHSLVAALLAHRVEVVVPIPAETGTGPFEQVLGDWSTILQTGLTGADAPVFLLGHSFSGLVVAALVDDLRGSLPLAGTILMGCGLWSRGAIAALPPNAALDVKNFHRQIARLSASGKREKIGPLGVRWYPESKALVEDAVDGPFTGRSEKIERMLHTKREGRPVELPCLSICSVDDRIVPLGMVQAFQRRYFPLAVEKLYRSLGHMDLGASPGAAIAWRDLAAWILDTAATIPKEPRL